MFGKSFKPVRPGMPLTRQVRELQRAVTAARNQRPGSGYRAITTPFGTAIMSAATDWFTAYTGDAGVGKSVIDANGNTTLGTGNVFQSYPTFDDQYGTITLVPDKSRSIPVYNLSLQPVAGKTNVIIGKVYGLLFVMWESCPEE